MALALTEEHLALAESVRGWAGRAAPAEALRAAVAAGDGGAALYRARCGPRSPARACSACTCPSHSAARATACRSWRSPWKSWAGPWRRGPSCRPCWPAPSCTRAGGRQRLNGLVKDMAGGTLTGAVGFAPGICATGPAATGAGATGTLVIDGACGPVPGAGLADVLILPAALGGEEGDRRWVVVDAADVEITQLDSLDLTRQAARVRADQLSVPAGAGPGSGCRRAR